MIPQGYPLTIWLLLEGDPVSEAIEASVVGWIESEDPSFMGSQLGDRYAPVVLMAADGRGAWPVDLHRCQVLVRDPRQGG